MRAQQQPVSDMELHALVDGQLASERMEAVTNYLTSNPEAAGRVAAWKADKAALGRLFAQAAHVPPNSATQSLTAQLAERLSAQSMTVAHKPSALAAAKGRWGTAWRVAATVSLVLVGSLAGWASANFSGMDLGGGIAGGFSYTPAPLQTFAAAAVRAHKFYTQDSPFMVEIGGDRRDDLNGWVSQRLGQRVVGPDLSGVGFELIGGRTLPTANGPGAQYIYRDQSNLWLTLFVAAPRVRVDRDLTIYQQAEITGVYWADGGLAYALIGQIGGPDRLLEVSGKVRNSMADSLRKSPEASRSAAGT